MTNLSDIGYQLRAARKARGLFKTRLAEASGLHRNTVADLESGKGNVELKTLLAICDQLGLEVRLVPKRTD